MNEPSAPIPVDTVFTRTEYKRMVFLKHEVRTGGLPAAFDTAAGGSIVRVTGNGRDDVTIQAANPNAPPWVLPWTSVAWAIEGRAEPKRIAPQRRPGVTRVKQDGPRLAKAKSRPAPEPELEAEEVEAADPDAEEAAEAPPPPKKPPGEWRPPKPPKKPGQRRVSVPKPEE